MCIAIYIYTHHSPRLFLQFLTQQLNHDDHNRCDWIHPKHGSWRSRELRTWRLFRLRKRMNWEREDDEFGISHSNTGWINEVYLEYITDYNPSNIGGNLWSWSIYHHQKYWSNNLKIIWSNKMIIWRLRQQLYYQFTGESHTEFLKHLRYEFGVDALE